MAQADIRRGFCELWALFIVVQFRATEGPAVSHQWF